MFVRFLIWGTFFSCLLSLTACFDNYNYNYNKKIKEPESLHKKFERIGIILPLSGKNKAIGERMLEAAKLAFSPDRKIDIFDDSNPRLAAQKAIDARDAIVIGPLTGEATESVSAVLKPAGVEELSFSSNEQQARKGIWVMGLTPSQQITRLVNMAIENGHKKFAAFLPETPFGYAFASALTETCAKNLLVAPRIIFHKEGDGSIDSIFKGMKELVNVEDRSSSIDQEKQEPNKDYSLPFDALFLGDTGISLGYVIKAMKENDIDSNKVQIMGPALWRSFDSKLLALRGAWYTALPINKNSTYVIQYKNHYNRLPSPVTNFSYDAAVVANNVVENKKHILQDLLSPNGFLGVNGAFRFLPNGRIERFLDIYQILPGGGAELLKMPEQNQDNDDIPFILSKDTSQLSKDPSLPSLNEKKDMPISNEENKENSLKDEKDKMPVGNSLK